MTNRMHIGMYSRSNCSLVQGTNLYSEYSEYYVIVPGTWVMGWWVYFVVRAHSTRAPVILKVYGIPRHHDAYLCASTERDIHTVRLRRVINAQNGILSYNTVLVVHCASTSVVNSARFEQCGKQGTSLHWCAWLGSSSFDSFQQRPVLTIDALLLSWFQRCDNKLESFNCLHWMNWSYHDDTRTA